MTRTKAGVILEKLLHGMKHRYSLCWNGEEGFAAYDCGCCMSYIGGETQFTIDCGCICHRRIEEMAQTDAMKMFLLALEPTDEMPFVPKDEDDWVEHIQKFYNDHNTDTRSCDCKDCVVYRRIEDRKKSEAKGN